MATPRPLTMAVSLLAVAACFGMAWPQVGHWRNSFTLFSHALEVTTENMVAHNNLGSALESAGRMDEAAGHYREASRIKPKAPQPYNNLGNVLDEAGHLAEALAAYEQALRLRPGVALVHNNMGGTLAKQGRLQEARTHFLHAMTLQPREARAHYLLGSLELREGDARAAAREFQTALQLNPAHLNALLRLARIRAANEDASLRQGAEAVDLAERAVAMTERTQAEALHTLAMAYAEAGRFEEAIKIEQEALQRRPVATSVTDVPSTASPRLTLYLARRPYRETTTEMFADLRQARAR